MQTMYTILYLSECIIMSCKDIQCDFEGEIGQLTTDYFIQKAW